MKLTSKSIKKNKLFFLKEYFHTTWENEYSTFESQTDENKTTFLCGNYSIECRFIVMINCNRNFNHELLVLLYTI